MNEIQEKINSANKAFLRGGNFIQKIFSRPEKFLTAEEALYLMNTYGIPVREVILIAISHDFIVDESGFSEKVFEQNDMLKKSKLCALTKT